MEIWRDLFHAKGAKIFKRASVDQDLERLASLVIDCGMAVHVDVGPGLLESVYEALLAQRLSEAGAKVDRQRPVRAHIDGLDFAEAFRADLLIDNKLLVEIKSVEKLAPVHSRQVLTYLRLLKLPLGLLLNFNGITFKEGIKRVANNYREGQRTS